MYNMDLILAELTDDEDFLELIDLVENPRLPQTYRERPNHFEIWNDNEFKCRFRFSKETAQFVLDELHDIIVSDTNKNHALSPGEMFLLALRYLATGSFLQVLGDFCGVDKSTASRVVTKVLRAIASLKNEVIKMPRTEEEKQIVREGFYKIARFPRCIGAIDCTHIKLISPGGPHAELYRNRKNFFSMNVQMIGDANLSIRSIVCRWPGSAHDSNIFRNSRVRHEFEHGIYGEDLLVGDSGYGIKPYLITPLTNPRTDAENLFNESQIRTRNPIERLFGVLKRRFPILALGIRLRLDKVEAVVVACSVLHNICMMKGEDINELPLDEEIEAAIQLSNDINIYIQDPNIMHNAITIKNATRQVLINYFQNIIHEQN